MNVVQTVTCPKCAANLVTEGLEPDQTIQCASCRAKFRLETTLGHLPHSSRQVSRSGWSLAACYLGVLSLLPLFGLAALVAGILGVRDLRRYPAKHGLKGAIFGILAGSLTSLFWVFVGLATVEAVLSVRSRVFTTNPTEVTALAARIAHFQLPSDIQPLAGQDLPGDGIRWVIYGHESSALPAAEQVAGKDQPSVLVAIGQFPKRWNGQRKRMEDRLRNDVKRSLPRIQVQETLQVTYTLQDGPLQVTKNVGRDPESGAPGREYLAFLSSNQGPIAILIITGDEPPGTAQTPSSMSARANLSEDEIRQFFESYR